MLLPGAAKIHPVAVIMVRVLQGLVEVSFRRKRPPLKCDPARDTFAEFREMPRDPLTAASGTGQRSDWTRAARDRRALLPRASHAGHDTLRSFISRPVHLISARVRNPPTAHLRDSITTVYKSYRFCIQSAYLRCDGLFNMGRRERREGKAKKSDGSTLQFEGSHLSGVPRYLAMVGPSSRTLPIGHARFLRIVRGSRGRHAPIRLAHGRLQLAGAILRLRYDAGPAGHLSLALAHELKSQALSV